MKANSFFRTSSLMASAIGLGFYLSLLFTSLAWSAELPAPAAHVVRYHTMEVDGLKIFYREAGRATAPVVLLLHGFPASSFMYRNLIEELSDHYRVIAPDYPGFGYSDAPAPDKFSYTFDRLAQIIDTFAEQLQLKTYALYMQDFGGPVGFRLASKHPQKITHLIVQNANAYQEGLPDNFWTPARRFWKAPTPENYTALRDAAMSDAALAWNYTHGTTAPERISPDSWTLQKTLLARPGNKDAMMALLYDYRTNLERYSEWQRYFRARQPPMLIAWGRNDVIFPADGAQAYLKDLPKAELHLLQTGHFALEEKSEEIGKLMLDFLRR